MNATTEQSINTKSQDAASTLADTEARYLEIRQKLQEQGTLLDKHRKTVEACRHEEGEANEAWKKALRENGGNITKETRDLKRKAVIARETAEEIEALIAEMSPQFEDFRLATSGARAKYADAWGKLKLIETKASLEEACEQLFASDQGKSVLSLILSKNELAYSEYFNSPLGEGLNPITQSTTNLFPEERNEIERRKEHYLFHLVCGLAAKHGVTPTATVKPLLPRQSYELDAKNSKTLIPINQAINRLKAQGLI